MEIIRKHGTKKETAVATIDTFLDALMQKEFPGSVTIEQPAKEWEGDRMKFSFQAKKGFFGTKISGTVHVDEEKVQFHADLPPIVTRAVPEEKIVQTINAQFDELFPQSKMA